MNDVTISKFLSYVLRHRPDAIGLTLDENGWAETDDLLTCSQRHGKPISVEVLKRVVAQNDKKRFEFSQNNAKIRASQGHSVAVRLDYQPKQPPALLYHGTIKKFMEQIQQQGLCKMKRHHVHLSADQKTASKVGSRRGIPVILQIRAEEMHNEGHAFFLSTNGVWLVEHVPPEFIDNHL